MNGDKIEVGLDFVTAGASKALDGLSKSFTSTFNKMGNGVSKVGDSLGGMVKSLFSVQTAVVSAGTAFVTYIGSKQVLEKAIAQEEAVNSISIALARNGEYSKDAVREMERWASSLQEASIYGDEETLQQASLAMAFGASADQAKLMTRAAIELSAATGKSLGESTRQLAKTLGGFAGELGEVNPKIKALSAEQLKAGEAAKVLLDQYGGTAVGKIKTFSGAMTQNKNLFGDLLEQIGFLITKNPVVIEGIRALSDVFIRLGTYLQDNRTKIISFVNDGLVKMVTYAPQVGSGLKVISDVIAGIVKTLSLATAGISAFIRVSLEVKAVSAVFDGLIWVIGQAVGGIADLLSVLARIPSVAGTLEAIGINAESLATSLDKVAKSSYNAIESFNSESTAQALEKFEDITFSIVESTDAINNGLKKSIDNGVKSAEKLAGVIKGISATGEVEVKVVNNEESVKRSIDNYQQLLELTFGGGGGAKIGNALITSIATGLKSGADGARAMLSSVAGAAADAFLPGLGAVVGPLTDALASGPDAVRDMVKQFAGAIPELVQAIIEAIPVLIEELANQFPIVVERIADKMDEIIEALIEAMPDVIAALVASTPKLISAIIKNLPKILGSFVSTLIKEAPRFITALVEGVWDAVKDLLGFGDGGLFGGAGDAVGGVWGSSKNGSGVYGSTAKALKDIEKEVSGFFEKTFGWKFAKGGEVPAGFPNDTLPARLSSGEYVIDRGLTKDLKRMVKERDTGVQTALLAKIARLLEQPQAVESKVTLNQREFANIILQLNRTSQRIS